MICDNIACLIHIIIMFNMWTFVIDLTNGVPDTSSTIGAEIAVSCVIIFFRSLCQIFNLIALIGFNKVLTNTSLSLITYCSFYLIKTKEIILF